MFSIPTGVGVRKRLCFQHRSAFRLLVDVLLFSFQGSLVGVAVSTATLISYQNLIVMSTKSFAYSFTSLRLNQQLNKYISLTYISQHYFKTFCTFNSIRIFCYYKRYYMVPSYQYQKLSISSFTYKKARHHFTKVMSCLN